MAKKIICESCGTIFPFDKVKDMLSCPVCDAPFDEDEGAANGEVMRDDGLMYFDEIATSYKERPDFNGVEVYCKECKTLDSIDLDKFSKFVDKQYVVLKDGVTIKCRGCGKEHKPRKILFKLKDHYAPPLPRCPACNSVMLKRITKTSKFVAAATVGVFALPYNSKTFECKDCGYRF